MSRSNWPLRWDYAKPRFASGPRLAEDRISHMKRALVVFSGLDGSGKSTQMSCLQDRLNCQVTNYVTIWSRGGYTRGMELLKRILRTLFGSRVIPPAGPSQARTTAMASSWKRRLWLRLAILDLIRLYSIVVRWQLFLGKVVLFDRYWQDTQLDFRLNFPGVDFESWWLWRLMVRCAPRPDHAFLLRISADESRARSLRKQEPFPAPEGQLASRAAFYDQLDGDWVRIDGMLPADVIAERIWQSIQPHTKTPAA